MRDDWDDTDATPYQVDQETLQGRATSAHQALTADKAMLVVLVGPNSGQTYAVDNDVVTIGRSRQATIRLTAEDVSRKHVTIAQVQPGVFVVRDLGSRNGTLVNGVAITERTLKFGDKLRVGNSSLFLFSRYDQLEDELLAGQRLESLGSLAGKVAHDFNNILGALRANVDYLIGLSPSTTFDDVEVKEALSDADHVVRRAIDLTRQLLGLSGKHARRERGIDIGQLLHETARLIHRTLPRSIELQVEVDDGLYVTGHSSQLHQMLVNFCVNARDAMPDGGRLRIKGHRRQVDQPIGRTPFIVMPGSYVQILVEDTGAGISAELRERIFEPFFTTKERGKGTGLGLATALSIVRHHSGQIQFDSEPGDGTRFSIFLPAEDTPSAAAARPGYGNSRRAIVGATHLSAQGEILLVDDDDSFRNSTRRLLEGMGYEVRTASGGRQAIEEFSAFHDQIELVLLDLVMPDLGGREVFTELRHIRSDVQVIISSGQTEVGVRELLTDGARAFLQKPYDAESLGQVISRVMFDPFGSLDR